MLKGINLANYFRELSDHRQLRWAADLLGICVQWRTWLTFSLASSLAVLGGRKKAHLEVGYLSSSYLILPAPILQVPPSTHPEHRRKKITELTFQEVGFLKHNNKNICYPIDVRTQWNGIFILRLSLFLQHWAMIKKMNILGCANLSQLIL